MNPENMTIAVNVALGRVHGDAAQIEQHLGGSDAVFGAMVVPYMGYIAGHVERDWEGERGEEYALEVQRQVTIGLFMLGRAFEELELIDRAQEGALDILCSKCGGIPKESDNSED